MIFNASVGQSVTEPVTLTATLTAAGWTGDEAPYTQTVSVTGITAETSGIVSVADNVTAEQYQAVVDAMLHKNGQTAGNVTVTAFGKRPEVDIPIAILVV